MGLFHCLVIVGVMSTILHCQLASSESQSEAASESEPENLSNADSNDEESRNLRARRDGYSGSGYGGGGGGYGGGGGGYGGGSYGCHCPYQQCDSGSDMLLYFAAGALLGLLFSMLTAPAMMMAAAPAPTGRRSPSGSEYLHKSATSNLSELPKLLSQDIAPLAMELTKVYTMSQTEPQCGRRWLCEVTQTAMKKGGLKGRLSSFASVAVSWMMQDMMPFLENLTGDVDDLDCSIFAPKCRPFFEIDTESKNKDNT